MFEKDAEERARKLKESQTLGIYDNEEDYELDRGWNEGEVAGYEDGFKDGAEFGYNKAKEEQKGKCKTAYIKGIRTMANALKDYDRTYGAWTDYFEHSVEEVLKRLLKESE